MSKLYTNENFPLPTVEQLRLLGHDVLTSAESGNAGQRIPDDEVLQYSVREQRILVTLNRLHSVRLHNLDANHVGLVVCTFDPDFVGLAKRIDMALAGQSELKGRLIRINRPNQ